MRMLLADDVGLGKTIEAGLIITELLGRQQATRLLVICLQICVSSARKPLNISFMLMQN